MRFSSKFAIASLLVALMAGPAVAQNHPWPGSSSAAPVLCNGCPGNNSSGQANNGLPTYPYRAPITKHVGRFVDSSTTLSMQHYGFRTARAGRVRIAPGTRGTAPGRAYLQIGESVGAYTLANFFTTTLPSALESVGGVQTGERVGGAGRDPLEKIQMFEQFVYPEARSSGWSWQLVDTQHTLGDFDFDDRGYIYAAFPPYGWGIMRDDGATNGTHMTTHKQVTGDAQIGDPTRILSLHVGTKYYAIVSDYAGLRYQRWDVTNAASPSLEIYRSNIGFKIWAKYEAGQRLAYVANDGKVHIFNYSDFVGSGGEIASYSPSSGKSFVDLAFDESGNLWLAEGENRTTANVLVKLAATGATYTKQTFDVYGRPFNPKFLAVGGGFVALSGTGTVYNGNLGLDVALFKITGGAPVLVDTDGFFTKYYHTAPAGYAQPPANGGYTNFLNGIALYKHDGKTYLFYSPFGLGDVFELEGSDSISLQMKTTSFGTPNPNSKATDPGPYVGDIVTFTSRSSNPAQTYAVDWDFGNPDSGILNFKRANTGVDVTHQYTSYTTAGQITAAKTVTATLATDTNISSTLPLSLKVPTVRIGFPSGASNWIPVTAATANLKAVAGQQFTDASDGSVESHFNKWTVDTTDTTNKPNNTVPVGGIGTHTVKLEASYGRYDSTTYAITSPYKIATPSITYTVVPFLVKLNSPVKSGSNVTFSAAAVHTPDTAIMSATQWTVTWTLTGGSGASAQATQQSTVAVGTIPNFAVPAPIAPNSTITVDVAVDPTKLVSAAQNYASSQDSQLLSTPDPKIVQSGCANANEPCSFTMGSLSNASTAEWAPQWTLRQGNTTLLTSTATTFSPTITEAGTYTVQLKVVKSVFEANAADKNFTVAAAVCSPLPSSDALSITSSCTSNCDVGETVTFVATAFGYTFQDCDTFTWNFGDGTSGTGKKVTKAYTTKKSYNVRLTVKNSTSSTGVTIEKTITVGGTSEPPPPPPPTCQAPTGIGISWFGATSGCGPGGVSCRTGESITFTGRRGSGGLLSCDNVQWTFGDGSTSESETSARNTYSAPGTYQVTLVVSNEFGTSSPATANITIVAAPSSCSIAPHEGNILIKYHGLESGCRDSNVTPCKKNEQINFEAGKFGYDFQSCDTFEWTWGDGSAKSTAQNPSHVFTANGNSFTVSLKVANANGGATVTREVSFGQSTPTQPQPVLTFDNFPSAGTKNKPVTFKVNSNIDATGWTWSFGDGTPDDTSQSGSTAKTKSITHTFASAGQFTVRVFARNAAGAASDTPGAVQAKITVTEAPPEPEYRYLLPVVTHIGGQGGSTWRTDVQIYSQDPTVSPAKPLTMTALLRDNVLGEITRTLEVPSSTYIYEDFMRVFYNGNGSGPVIITAKGQYAPQIWTRTYNQTEAGTFGQFIPAIRIDDAGAGSAFGDGKYYLAGLRHDDSYRTNFGLVNPNSSAVNVQMRVYDDQGLPLGTFTRTLQSFQLDQFPIVGPGALSSITNTRPFSIEIEVPSGQWLIAYASLINRGSNDPVFLQAVRESELASADYRSIVLPGVGHTGDWRSDVTVFNPNGRKINVDLAYHDGAGVKRGEALGVPIGAGEFLQYNDLLHQGVFGTVPDGVGILRVTVPESIAADRFPLVVARTFNDNGTGKTFGQGITGFAVPRANVKPNKPALIPAVRDNTKFYTNVGLTNTTNAVVNATVKLLDPGTGAEVKSVGFTLQPYQSIVGRYTLDGRDNASLKVEADGNIWAFVSIIDKFTFDPEYVPATPLQ